MKKNQVLLSIVVLMVGSLFFSCGILYTNLKTPMPHVAAQTNDTPFSKVGAASCTSYLGLVALGDCSTNAAMENGGITKIHHVDTRIKSILCGVYEKYTLVVYGE